MSFCDAVEAAAVILQSCLVKLRDEAQFRDYHDDASLNAAHFLAQMLEDAQEHVRIQSALLERRLMMRDH